jgi:hypothetical protein
LTGILSLHLVTLSPCHLVTLQAAENEAPTFLLHTAAGKPTEGPLLSLGDKWAVRLGGEEKIEANSDAVIVLRQKVKPLPPIQDTTQVIFTNGDHVPAGRLKLVGERLQFAPNVGQSKDLRTPLSAVSVIWLAKPDGCDNPMEVRRGLVAQTRLRDVAHLRNGDTLEGVLVGLDETTVRIEVDKKPVALDRAKVSAIALNTELARPLRPKGVYGRLVLADGSRLSLASASCTDGKLMRGVTLFGGEVRVPLKHVIALYLFQGRAVYLSDLKPKKVEEGTYLDDSWSVVPDGSVTKTDLRLASNTFDKGLGTHSKCRLTYNLGGAYRRFEAQVGIDDETKEEPWPRGGARIQVLVDGKPHDLGFDKELTAKNGLESVSVNVAGARELTLVVDFGKLGNVKGCVDWADARLIK